MNVRINEPTTPIPKQPKPEEKNIDNPGEPITKVAFNLVVSQLNSRLDNSNLLLIGVFFVLAICFLTLFFGYWQFASSSFNDYSQKAKELQDGRYEILQKEIDIMAGKVLPKTASSSSILATPSSDK